MSGCTAPVRGHRTSSGAAACPVCGPRRGYRGYGGYGGYGGYAPYSPPSYSPPSYSSSRSSGV
ncbi:MAG TPA: hypothetical protein VHW69_11965, partial [Rhizomicrobium sp.]|nr:hypothetical protein [Rhizomicrobium sp.]